MDCDRSEAAFAQGGGDRSHVEHGVDGVARLRVGEREFQCVPRSQAAASPFESDARGSVRTQIERLAEYLAGCQTAGVPRRFAACEYGCFGDAVRRAHAVSKPCTESSA